MNLEGEGEGELGNHHITSVVYNAQNSFSKSEFALSTTVQKTVSTKTCTRNGTDKRKITMLAQTYISN